MKYCISIHLRNFVFFLVLIVFSEQVFAQRIEPNRWIIKADGGISVFFGDVKRYDIMPDYESPSEIQPMFSASIGKEISRIFSVRGQFVFGNLSGHKKSAKYNFKSDILGAHLLADINLYYLFTGERFGKNRFNIYTSLGVGYTNWNTKLYYDNPQPWGSDIASTNSNGAFSIPASLSMEYVFNKNFAVNIEGLLSVVSSDEVDAVVGGISFDSYMYASLGLVYKFKVGSKKKKSRIKYALAPELCEAQPGDPQYVEEVAVVEASENEVQEVTQADDAAMVEAAAVVAVVAVDEEQEQTEVAGEEIAVVDKYENEEKIDHKVESAAIKREVWVADGEEAWPDIEFSVQVSASKVPLNSEKIQADLGISETIYERNDNIWYRYSAGRYHKVWKARELRNILRSKYGVSKAFIVVYRDDKRISLEEALNFASRKQSVKEEEKSVAVNDNLAVEQVYPVTPIRKSIPEVGIMIGIQILAITNHEYPLDIFPGIYDIEKSIYFDEKQPWYRFIVGTFASYEEAKEFLPSTQENGFSDAFIVAYKDGKKISIKQLKEELNK